MLGSGLSQEAQSGRDLTAVIRLGMNGFRRANPLVVYESDETVKNGRAGPENFSPASRQTK
jgi:hypothetical protein